MQATQNKKANQNNLFEKVFKLSEHNTNVKTEVIAGITTFMTMAYILAVNSNMLSQAGMDAGAVFVATALSLFDSLLLSINASGHSKYFEYLYAFFELPASVATTTILSNFLASKYFSNKCFAVTLSHIILKYACIAGLCKSHVITLVAPAASINSAKSFAVIGTLGWSFLSDLEYI